MRLQTLELQRYGKFAGEVLELPRAACDFHFIVGPNEAGKSTIRSAIADLLFGMPRSSTYAFGCELSELRLGAVLQFEDGLLAFDRIKANKDTLRDKTGKAIPDARLADMLGNIDRTVFEQMFGLDHQRLLDGGKDILKPSSSLGQILFQSASGIDSLSRVQEALEKEAEGLFTSRKAQGRKFYVAMDAYTDAQQKLKELSVRPQAWTRAIEALDQAQQELAVATARRASLEALRTRLERVRRTAPILAALRDAQSALAALNDPLVFSEDAATQWRLGRDEMVAAEPAVELSRAEIARLEEELKSYTANARLLASATDIVALDKKSSRYGDHEGDLVLRGQEVAALLADAARLAEQLGRPGDEDALRQSLPGELAVTMVAGLIKERSGVLSLAETAQDNLLRQRNEVEALERSRELMSVVALSVGLPQALADAQTVRGAQSRQAALQKELAAASRSLQQRLQSLPGWSGPVEGLMSLPVPAEEAVQRLGRERQQIALALGTARATRQQANAKVAETALAVQQFSEARHLASEEEVRHARAQRDAAWGRIKAGEVGLPDGAPSVDAGIAEADGKVDARLASAKDVAELLSLQQTLVRDTKARERAESALAEQEAALASLDARWGAMLQEAGMPAMTLDDAPTWLARRRDVLDAAGVLEQKDAERVQFESASLVAQELLCAEMRRSGATGVEGLSLAELVASAAAYQAKAREAELKLEGLEEQLRKAKSELELLQGMAQARQTALENWRGRWEQVLAGLGLERYRDAVETVEKAVEQLGQVRDKLEQATRIRADRIDKMRADLANFAAAAQALAAAIAPDLLDQAPASIAHGLLTRLQAEQDRKKAAQRVEASMDTLRTQLQEAEKKLASAKLRLQPLFAHGQVEELDALAAMIERSDQHRTQQRTCGEARTRLLENADGLSLDAVIAEIDAEPVTTVKSRVDQLQQDLHDCIEQEKQLEKCCDEARQARDAIDGGDSAANEEARRQESLAEMGMIAERWSRVTVAGRLLQWAIERYREQKQGPLLKRAGEIFSGLTLGAFDRLVVDFDAMTLVAVRSQGGAVGVEGLSDGTRDQLFLALRLAALEMQIGQGRPLPFIADDLFINFDDARALAGLQALRELSKMTQVIFLSHHEHMTGLVQQVFGNEVNVLQRTRESDLGIVAAA